MQTIVDHHHASDQKQATKVRFSEPGDENEDDPKVSANIFELNLDKKFTFHNGTLINMQNFEINHWNKFHV